MFHDNSFKIYFAQVFGIVKLTTFQKYFSSSTSRYLQTRSPLILASQQALIGLQISQVQHHSHHINLETEDFDFKKRLIQKYSGTL